MELVGFTHLASCFSKLARVRRVAALRSQTADFFNQKTDVVEPLWDRMSPTGQPCSSWSHYQNDIRTPASWAGELEILAAAAKWNLRVFVVRPGLPTVQIGAGKSYLWVIYRNQHYEPP